MGDVMVIDVSKHLEKKVNKRKRDSLSVLDKESRIDQLKKEIDGLFKYFKEVSDQNVIIIDDVSSVNSVIACLLEGSNLPYSKLVDKIYGKVRSRDGVTLASVRSAVLLVGQRSIYGIANADADVLEDSSEECLWCWETRDMKLIPTAQRGPLYVRRTCRKKIQDRISAVSAALQVLDSHVDHKYDVMKASEKLGKVLNEAEIRLLVENLLQKSGSEMADKETKLKEKVLIKELDKNKRELEKEKKRIEREQLKEKLQNEKEQKRLKDEAEKEERLREKEEAELKKTIRKQQEEAEKEQRRREKEAAQLKEQLSLKKQATLMQRFFKCKTTSHQGDPSSTKAVTSDSPGKGDVVTANAVTLSMDSIFSLKEDMDANELQRIQKDAWSKFGSSIHSGSSMHWGIRQKPKAALVKELKLQGSSSGTGVLSNTTIANKNLVRGDGSNSEKVLYGWADNTPDDRLYDSSANCCPTYTQICNRTKKLLQFDKSHRPAYYGTMSVKSDVIGPRCPLKKDPKLDYDVESDEEWEEEDPGESLSDCDKDEEEENLMEGNLKIDDEDGSEDDFFVPDGYLSENEGVQVDSMETDTEGDNTRSSPRCNQDLENDEFRALFRQQKHINNLTEHALQKNQPLIISNLMHEKTQLIAEDLNGTAKLEHMFLQALSLRPFPGSSPIEILTENNKLDEDEELQELHCSSSNTSVTRVTSLVDKDLPKIVSLIQSCPHRIGKVVESLRRSFPDVPKSHLKSKVQEISEFVDNRWKVKKEVLGKLGFSISPGKSIENSRGIATFFSKRCLPPTGGPMKTDETSPQQCCKTERHCREERCVEELL